MEVVKHEWYQTPTHVILTIFAKKVAQDKISVDHIAGDEVAFYGFLRQFEERSARSSRVSIHPEVLENLGSARGGQGKHFQLILSRR